MSQKLGIILALAATILGYVSNQDLKIIIKSAVSEIHVTHHTR